MKPRNHILCTLHVLRIALLSALFVYVYGCSAGVSVETGKADIPTIQGQGVHEVVLKDGTRCAVVLTTVYGGMSSGISCDWRE